MGFLLGLGRFHLDGMLPKCLFAWSKAPVGVYLFERTQFLRTPVINVEVCDSR